MFSDFRGVSRAGGGPLAALSVASAGTTLQPADGPTLATAASLAARLLEEGNARGTGPVMDSTAHLEGQMAASWAVGSFEEYVYW